MQRLAFALFCLLFSHLANASTNAVAAVVDAQWLGNNLNNPDLLIVDIRPQNIFEYAHIKGSTNTDLNQWRATVDGVESMLPSKRHLEVLLGRMGATAQHHIVIVSSGDSPASLASATRVYWTLEQIGHAKKSVLDGGIIAYARARLPLANGSNKTEATEYTISQAVAKPINADAIMRQRDQLNLIDVRSKAEYLGIFRGAPDERVGTIPDAKSLPFNWFSKNDDGHFQSPDNVQTLLDSLTLADDKTNVVYCHTGMRASLAWFVLHEIMGMQNVVLYDGSTREWARRADLPFEQILPIKN